MADYSLPGLQDIFSVAGKVVLVTGGSKGLGLAAASGLLQYGASKVFLTARNASECDDAARTLRAIPGLNPGTEVYSTPSDSSTQEGIQRLFDAVSETTDHIDILLLNAGAAHHEAFETHDAKKWDDVLNINLKAVFYTAQK